MKRREKSQLVSIRQILEEFDWDKKKYITREFQDFGYRLAVALGDLRNKSLYIKLAKEVPREVLEEALNFVKEASNVRSKPRLFMWKLKELKEEKKRGGD
jgi:hypothetical protein